MKNITIIGAGNIGTAIVAVITQKKDYNVVVYSTRAGQWSDSIEYKSMDSKDNWKNTTGYRVTGNMKKAVEDADIIFVTLPSFMRENFINEITNYKLKQPIIAFIPGVGGVEFFCENLMRTGCQIVGFDRVPCVSRVKEYGKKVEFEWKNRLRIAGVNVQGKTLNDISQVFAKLLDIDFLCLDSYLSITMTPSNPIMHPVRLFTMFNGLTMDSCIDHKIPFYGEWDDYTSECLLKCDKELEILCNTIGIRDVVPLRLHYEADTPAKMTKKLQSIQAFKNVQSPLIECSSNCYKIDFSSRYFKEDFPFGMYIIKGMAQACSVDVPMFDKIVNWYMDIIDKPNDYHSIPVEKGLDSIEKIRDFYKI